MSEAGFADATGRVVTTPDYPAVDESFNRLRRAGWSIGDVAMGAD